MSKILIVEDEDAIRRVLKKVLYEENSKFIIDEAVDGVDAEKKIKSNSYDLVILMPLIQQMNILKRLNYFSEISIGNI